MHQTVYHHHHLHHHNHHHHHYHHHQHHHHHHHNHHRRRLCALWVSWHYSDVITGTIASQITSLTTVYSTVYSDADQRKHQSSASLAFMRGIHRGAVNSPHKGPVTRKMFPFDDVIMIKQFTQPYLFSGIHHKQHKQEPLPNDRKLRKYEYLQRSRGKRNWWHTFDTVSI